MKTQLCHHAPSAKKAQWWRHPNMLLAPSFGKGADPGVGFYSGYITGVFKPGTLTDGVRDALL